MANFLHKIIRKNTIYLVFIIGILSWYILPQVKYSITYVPMALICGIFIVIQILFYPQFKKVFFQMSPWMLLFSMMYVLFAYPLSLKKGLWLIMIQILEFTPFFIFISLVQRKRIGEMKIIFFVLSIMFIFTEIKTLREFTVNPEIARFLTEGSIDEEHTNYRMQGIAGFGFSYAIGLIIPFLLSMSSYISNIKWKTLFVAFFLLSFIYVLKSQFVILILLTIFSLVYLIVRRLRKASYVILICVLVVFLLIELPDIFQYLANLTHGTPLGNRLSDISMLLNSGDLSGPALNARFNAYKNGILIFLKSPLWGNEVALEPRIDQAHSVYIDYGCKVGIIGLIFYITTWFIAKMNINLIIGDTAKKLFFQTPFLFFLILAFFNPIAEAFETWTVLFLYIPLGVLVFQEHNEFSTERIT
jgi:hypothetical protein